MNFIYRKMLVWRHSLGRTGGESVNSRADKGWAVKRVRPSKKV